MISLLKKTKFRVGNSRINVEIHSDKSHYYIKAPYDKKLIEELKLMQGAKWMGYDDTIEAAYKKTWRVNICSRNKFAFAYLEELKPYAKYTSELVLLDRKEFERPLYNVQIEMVSHGLQRKQCELACEMGVGKTLASIEIIERSGVTEWWYVGTRSSLAAVQLEFARWKAKVWPDFLTYEELKKRLKEWIPGVPPPQGVFFDEASKVKNPTAQRSQAAFYLSESMREAYGDNAYIIEMSGAPAPKSPVDWYWQAEIACPGYLSEGNIDKLKYRLAVIEKINGIDNVQYPKLITWRDGNTNLCDTCGYSKAHLRHDDICDPSYHEFIPLRNEVHRLYERMKGLVLVKFKKDCLDLPDKVYKQIKVPATPDVLKAAKLVIASSRTAIEALTRLRELSDGFQYKESVVDSTICTFCNGKRIIETVEEPVKKACVFCNGTGKLNKLGRETIPVESPKLEALKLELENFEDDERIVIYSGFTASIDRICETVYKQDWHYIRVDGRGWQSTLGLTSDVQMLKAFQDKNLDKKIAFVGHPGSAGMGLTLTASHAIIYFSNDFNAESRIQSEDRIHRAGMDVNKGALIIDMICLPSDEKVLANLKKKRDLLNISLGELTNILDESERR